MIYETEKDRLNERKFLSKIKAKFKCSAIKLPYDWQIDYIMSRKGEASCFAELKTRTHRSTDYPSVIISEHKAKKALWYSKHLGPWEKRFDESLLRGDDISDIKHVPFVYFVRFTDKDYWGKVTEDMFKGLESKKLSARNHAENHLDTEWIRYIPISLMKEF